MERWLPVPGYEGHYEVSDAGQVASVKRGRRLVLKQQLWRQSYWRVQLYNGTGKQRGHYVHSLVLLAFVGSRPEELITRHLNGDSRDNRLTNLIYGTYVENQKDSIQHGTQWQLAKTHCPQGHEYNEQNTIRRYNRRYCRPCKNARARKSP